MSTNRLTILIKYVFIFTILIGQLFSGTNLVKADSNITFKDVPIQSWYYEAVSELADINVLNGVMGNLYLPNQSLTRAEAAALIARGFNLELEITSKSGFQDIQQNKWYFPYIMAVQSEGYMIGDNKNFRPNDKITRAEFVTVLLRALEIEIDKNAKSTFVDISNHYLKNEIKTAYEKGLTNGINAKVFNPDGFVRRSEAAVFLYKETVFEQLPAASIGRNLVVKSIETTTTEVSKDSPNQILAFTVNNKKISLKDLVDAGYEVHYLSNKNVFQSLEGTESENGLLDVAVLNSIYEGSYSQRNFNYQIKLVKEGSVIYSQVQKVNVINFNRTAEEISSFNIKRGNNGDEDITINSNVLVLGEKYHFTGLKGTLKNGIYVDNLLSHIDVITYKSSNTRVAIVNHRGEITPISEGEVTISISTGDAKQEVDLQVVSQKRIFTKLIPQKDHVKMTSVDNEGVINEEKLRLVLQDQYGDPVYNVNPYEYLRIGETEIKQNNVTSNSVDISFYGNEPTALDGSIDMIISPIYNTSGIGKIDLFFAGTNRVAASIDLTVTGFSPPSIWEFKNVSTNQELKLDRHNEATLVLRLASFDANHIYMGDQNFFEGDITIKSNDRELVQVSTENKDIILTLGTDNSKTGRATLTAFKGSIPVASVTIDVIDSKPVVKELDFYDAKITNINNSPLYLEGDIIETLSLNTGGNNDFRLIDENTVHIYNSNRHALTIKLISDVVDQNRVSSQGMFSYDNNGDIVIKKANTNTGTFNTGDYGEIYLMVYELRNMEAVSMVTIPVDVR